ncbi:hypothetical protein TVAG_035210 [Trichomonas vaginalis G3]|uniref:Uncharacterized protein n=1 Tax=Trichomonas vaginalis (strain ATCC PRA-98 / G3) TaxID=412133 RepID=A2DAJ5_TRIV3|nr:hypothetical protein TVAGG3_0811250 [Trichomonas vaginalis G3]EAY22498.1 hypothetical protein TVAG_035210 [Trichomonas vaginalis G3]KAI5497224.1 hypothetical protein TVAGG3_0811250 [Trichomonas vaginalis G3]|eukprot:XP_001583484.1 hypothetical protein [Trichomonas vaginalis G3]
MEDLQNLSNPRNLSSAFQPCNSDRPSLEENKMNINYQDSSVILSPMNLNNAPQVHLTFKILITNDLAKNPISNAVILMDLIKSCHREDGEVLQFFEKLVYPRFIKKSKKYDHCKLNPYAVMNHFMESTFPVFFGKLI